MVLDGIHEIPASCESVFQALTDPEVLKQCIPGCEKLVQSGDNIYAITLSAGVGSIKGKFTGTVQIEGMTPPSHVKLTVEARGQPGFVRGSGSLDLEESEGKTTVRYSGDVQVGGLIASVGQRMIQGAARMTASGFFKSIENELGGNNG